MTPASVDSNSSHVGERQGAGDSQSCIRLPWLCSSGWLHCHPESPGSPPARPQPAGEPTKNRPPLLLARPCCSFVLQPVPRATAPTFHAAMDEQPTLLAPPAVSSLRADQGDQMERSLSQDIREEREELREAAEQTLNAIIDLNLDGTVKWVSPSWTDVVGTPFETVNGIPISDLIVSENKTVFSDVIDSMKRDDSKSYRVSFAIQLGPLSKLRSADSPDGLRAASQPSPQTADLEAQGIMVYDSVSGGESHVGIPGSRQEKMQQTGPLDGC